VLVNPPAEFLTHPKSFVNPLASRTFADSERFWSRWLISDASVAVIQSCS